MAKKGGGKHLKRYAAPRAVKLPRKSSTWTTKAAAGPHPIERAIPLRTFVRDYLSFARNAKEADHAISNGEILVDCVVRRDSKFPVGFMDVVRVPAFNRAFRILLDHRGRLVPKVVEGDDSVKLCKVVKKQITRGGKIQLTFHDGKNISGDLGQLKPGDVVKLSLPDFKVVERLQMEVGMLALVTGGKNTSKVGRIEEIKLIAGTQPNLVILRSEGESFQAPEHYIFVVGKETPVISLERGDV